MAQRNDEERDAGSDLVDFSSAGNYYVDHCYFPARYALALLSFLGFANVYALRVNMSVAIVAMVNSDDHQDHEFPWSKSLQGIILGSFFYGYIFTQIPGGWLAGRIGGKVVFGVGVLVTTLLTLVTPVAARAGPGWLIAVRVVEGIGEGVTFPAMHAIWGRWAPPLERSKLATITYAGPHVGTVLSLPLSGLLSKYGFGAKKGFDYVGNEWPSLFYVFGSIGVLWCLAWFWLAADTPQSHPRIHPAERTYIETSIASSQPDSVNVAVPWAAIVRSPAQWAIVVAHFCNNWGFYTLLTCLPTFMSEVLNFKVVAGGLWSALPYAVYAVLIPLCGQLADYLRESHLSTTAVRKIFTAVGLLLPAIFLVLTGFSTNHTEVLAFLTLGVATASPVMSGFNINHLDIAPRFAGVLMGISNMFATVPGMAGPVIADIMTPNSTAHEWRNVFILSAEIYAFGAFFYVVYGSGMPQWWAEGVVDDSADISTIQSRKKNIRKAGKQKQWGRNSSVTPLLYPTDDDQTGEDTGGSGLSEIDSDRDAIAASTRSTNMNY